MGAWGEDEIRRELHAVADLIEPAEDGLERIQAKLGRPCGSCRGTGQALISTPECGWDCKTCNGTGRV